MKKRPLIVATTGVLLAGVVGTVLLRKPPREVAETPTFQPDPDAAPAVAPPPPPAPEVAPTDAAEPADTEAPPAEPPPPPPPQPDANAATSAAERRAKSIIEAQPFRRTTWSGERWLVDVNVGLGTWWLLGKTGSPTVVHLETPRGSRLRLTEDGRLEAHGDDGSITCADVLPELPASIPTGWTAACSGAAWLRRTTEGTRTTREWATDLLRDNLRGGEQLTTWVRDSIYQDAYVRTASPTTLATQGKRARGAPQPARLSEAAATRGLPPTGLGLPRTSSGPMAAGRWEPIKDHPGVYLSASLPSQVDPALLAPFGDALAPLDAVESQALVYMVAFDLDAFELRYEVGTDHPRVGWSERVPPPVVDRKLPGPDGFATIAPLQRTGQVRPDLRDQLAATFIGGFKRSHGAFKTGDRATRDDGTHYGFIQEGAVLSRMIDGLATLTVDRAGRVDIATWSGQIPAADLRYARQNGVAILEQGASGLRPGTLLRKWSDGNWSGSVDGHQRSLRAGACIQDSEAGRFLLYGYFSTATPSAMAGTLLAYGCGEAMMLDMNALEHTYLALYERDETKGWRVRHLDQGMSVLDKTDPKRGAVPRFVGYADNRDFFYLLRSTP